MCVFFLPTYLFTESAWLGAPPSEKTRKKSAMEDRAAGIEAQQPTEDGANNGVRVRRRRRRSLRVEKCLTPSLTRKKSTSSVVCARSKEKLTNGQKKTERK